MVAGLVGLPGMKGLYPAHVCGRRSEGTRRWNIQDKISNCKCCRHSMQSIIHVHVYQFSLFATGASINNLHAALHDCFTDLNVLAGPWNEVEVGALK